MRNRAIPAGLAVAGLLLTAPYASRVAADPSWYALVSPAASGVSVDAHGLNASGTAAGYVQTMDGRRQAFVSLDGLTPVWLTTPEVDARAVAINDTGTVVGDALLAEGVRAVSWSGGALTNLGTLGGPTSTATGINAAGVVTGSADTLSTTVAFRFTPGAGMAAVAAPGLASYAYGINNAGTVVGQSYMEDGSVHAFVAPVGAAAVDLGTFGGPYAAATAVNDSGTVVGWALSADFTGHAFTWSGGALVPLAGLSGFGSSAEAINADGVIVGYAYTPDGSQHAVLWDASGGVVDLNTLIDPSLGWTLVSAQAINSAGQITGHGLVGGQPRVFVLTPPAAGDSTAPSIAGVSASPSMLWPPRHQLVPVTVRVSASDDSGQSPVCSIARVTSSEPDNGGGDGDTAGDIVRTGPLSLQLRAERVGNGPGRVYTIAVACADGSGNESQAVTYVTVTGDSTSTTTVSSLDSSKKKGKK
jgi:probable HAF family extracellular repeat protein